MSSSERFLSIYVDIRRFLSIYIDLPLSTYVDLCRVLSMSVEVADGGGPSGIAILISRTIHSEEGEAGMLVGIMAISISTFIVTRGVYKGGGCY